jgi:hypothetical protein
MPFWEGPNQKSEGFAKEKKKREGFAKEKKTCHICDAFHIATCGATVIANI